MKYLWSHRFFEVGHGWQPWDIAEVDLVAETSTCYKIRHKAFGIFPVYHWICKNSNSDIIEKIQKSICEKRGK